MRSSSDVAIAVDPTSFALMVGRAPLSHFLPTNFFQMIRLCFGQQANSPTSVVLSDFLGSAPGLTSATTVIPFVARCPCQQPAAIELNNPLSFFCTMIRSSNAYLIEWWCLHRSSFFLVVATGSCNVVFLTDEVQGCRKRKRTGDYQNREIISTDAT